MLLQFKNHPARVGRPKRIFISYSHRDQEVFDRLLEAIFPLKKEQLVECWHDRMLKPGEPWDGVIKESLESADLILFIVSPSFLASDYCQDIEVRRALQLCKEGKTKLVPLIARPTQWWDHELAALQALPPRARPLTDFPTVDEGIAAAVEALRVLLLDGSFFRDDSATGLSGIWQMHVSPRPESDGAIDVDQIVQRLGDWTKDASIRLIGYNSIPSKTGLSSDIILVLEGSAEAYVLLEKAQKETALAGVVDYPVQSFGRTVGSTMQTSSIVFNGKSQPPEDFINPAFTLFYPSDAFAPARFMGMQVDPAQVGHLNMMMAPADGEDGVFNRATYEVLVGYFTSALTIKEDHFWVNLSAYETNRMIPEELSGTRLGHDMLEFDVLLKQYTASLLSPDTETGRSFWESVLHRMAKEGVPLVTPIDTFQKVWIAPGKADIYVHEPGTPVPPELPWSVPESSHLAVLCETDIAVKTEWDHCAARHNGKTFHEQSADAIYMQEFDRFILPLLHEEINKNRRFATVRQIYNSLILAHWFRSEFSDRPEYRTVIDSNNPHALRVTLESVAFLQPAKDGAKPIENETSPKTRHPGASTVDHVDPHNASFQIAENRHFYDHYIQLFRKGLSRCVRTMEIEGTLCTRQYFSGAIEFSDLSPRVGKRAG